MAVITLLLFVIVLWKITNFVTFEPIVYERHIVYTEVQKLKIPEADAHSLIEDYFGEDAKVISNIVKCESNWDPKAVNKTTHDYGLFQIHNQTWFKYQCKGDWLNVSDNLKCAKKIYQNEGLNPWVSSITCWKYF